MYVCMSNVTKATERQLTYQEQLFIIFTNNKLYKLKIVDLPFCTFC